MYQQPANGQWNPNATPQPQWSPQPPNNVQFPPRPQQIPPISQALPQGPTMQTLQPQHPDQYRALPPPQQMFPPYQPQMQYAPAQPAPRQRTAIACRYCRRRKIRCSGFDQSEDGRCTNCQRFSQECVFTPVSAQTQAFVPAHTVWRGQNAPPNTQLYGAYGQPLPPQQQGRNEPYPPPGAQQQGQPQQQGQYPPPQGYPPQQQQQQQQQMYGPPPQQMNGQPQVAQMQAPQEAGRKRGNEEPHTPTLPPPNPAAQASPTSSNASFQSGNPQGQPYYNQGQQQPGRRASPQSATFSFDPPRASSSPQNLGQSGTPQPLTSNGLAPNMPIREGRTPPPGSAAAQRQGVKIGELVGGQKQEERTTTDSRHSGNTTESAANTPRRKEDVKDVGVQTDFS